jgi:hypothetical protein
MAGMRPVALGLKPHIGWAALVALAGPAGAPEVVAKRRVEMAATFDEGAVFHVGQKLPLSEAEALVRTSEERFERVAREALAALAAELRRAGLDPVASAVVAASGRPLPPLAAILRSHALVHAAEGELYRGVLARASEACGVPARFVPAKAIPSLAAGALGLSPSQLAARLAALGRASGRPWARDQKESALAAWVALATPRRERGGAPAREPSA